MSTFCLCGRLGKLATSCTENNPGRRFVGCQHFESGNSCGFFQWLDPPMCERSKQIIPGLIRKVENLQNKLMTRENELVARENDLENAIRNNKMTKMTIVFLLLSLFMPKLIKMMIVFLVFVMYRMF